MLLAWLTVITGGIVGPGGDEGSGGPGGCEERGEGAQHDTGHETTSSPPHHCLLLKTAKWVN